MKIGYLMQLGAEIRHPPFNGPANHVRHVVEELENLGHEVAVIYRIDGKIWRSNSLTDFHTVTAQSTEAGLFRLAEKIIRRIQSILSLPYLNWFESQRFAAVCVQELGDFDLLYERTSWMGYGGAIASRRLGIPLILEDNGDHLDDLDAKGAAPQGFQRRLSIRLMKTAVKQAAHIVSSGEGWRRRFIERWKVDPQNISTVENGTLLVRILKREQLASFAIPTLNNQPLKIVYLGGFYPWHGVPILLNAVRKALDLSVDLELTLIGSGDGFTDAQKQVERLNLGAKVRFTGQLPLEQFATLLAGSDLGVSPYCGWVEFSGLKIFDYKAAGLATLASGKDGMPGSITHGRSGWIVPPCDEEALLAALLELAKNRDRLRQMGQLARQEAETQHDWRHTGLALQQIFLKVKDNTPVKIMPGISSV